jgi:hypothetical protein
VSVAVEVGADPVEVPVAVEVEVVLPVGTGIVPPGVEAPPVPAEVVVPLPPSPLPAAI